MSQFLLILLILDARTGEPLDSRVIGQPYPSIKECMVAAVDQGPRKTEDSKASLVYCEDAADRLAAR